MEKQESMGVVPEFVLEGPDGSVAAKDFRGKWLVLYFYPKDNTPGCTKEACDFKDAFERFKELGALVVGISRDSKKSHDTFAKKYGLNFILLSDPSGDVHKAFGAWGEKKLYGKTKEGPIRSTFIIDPEGVVRKAWRRVKVEGHVAEVLEALEELVKASK